MAPSITFSVRQIVSLSLLFHRRQLVFVRDMKYQVKEKEIMIVMRWDAMRWMMRKTTSVVREFIAIPFPKNYCKHSRETIRDKTSRTKNTS